MGPVCLHGLYASRCVKCGAEPLNAYANEESPMNDTENPEPILQFFQFEHLPQKLQLVSKPFHDLAMEIKVNVPQNAERTVAFRKLLEAKDAAVRAALAKF